MHDIFEAHLAEPEAVVALADAADLAEKRPSALLFYEADPAQCHRRILTDRLVDQGFEVTDLRIPL